MKIILWIIQILLAVAFFAAGAMKVMTPATELAQSMAWVSDVPSWLVTFIGVAEVVGALGLVLPALTRIQPQLTPLAGAGLALVMLLAGLFHLNRGEIGMVIPNLVLLVFAAFVAYGRWKLRPIAPRST